MAERVERIAIFIDGANFFFMQKDRLHWWIDPKLLLDYIKNRFGEVTEANYYVAVDPENPKSDNYHKALTHMGFTLCTKPLITIQSDKGERRKANLDAEIVHDMLVSMNNYDRAILLSGDADFEKVLNTIKSRGKRFTVLSTQGFVSREIRSLAGMNFIDFETIREEVEKEQSED